MPAVYKFLDTFVFRLIIGITLTFVINCEAKRDLYPKEDLSFPNQAKWQFEAYHKRIKEFKADPIGFNKIVFLGNSITEAGGNWNERFNVTNAVNRGITGDYTTSLRARLNEIYYYKPLKVFLLIGINDIFDGVVPYIPEETPKNIAQNILTIVDSIKFHSKETDIFIHTILPVNEEEYRINRGFYPEHKYPIEKQIKEINTQILNLGNSGNYNIIDLHELFVNEEGKMTKELAKDGLHLNQNGYEKWCEHIKGIVKD